MRRKDLALRVLSTATFLAMVASCITPAFAGTYYIEDGNITIETEGDRVKVNGEYDDDEEIIIKGGANPNKPNEAAENQQEEETETSTETAENTVEAENKAEETETAEAADTEEEKNAESEEIPEEGESQDDAETQDDGEVKEVVVEQKQDEETPAGDAEAPVEEKQEEAESQQSKGTTEKETTAQEVSAPVSKAAKTSDDSEENSPKSSDPVKNVIKVVNNWVDKILNITLDNVKIDVSAAKASDNVADTGESALSIAGSGDTTIHLEGDNVLKGGNLRAGIEKNDSESTGKLTITAKDTDQTLDVYGGNRAAGIGGRMYEGSSNIEIAGGKITAHGNNTAAAIGGGRGGDGEVTITGGDVTAHGGSYASGIGGGSIGHGKVTITGGKVTADSNGFGTAIGGGCGTTGSGDITITGGEVNTVYKNGNSTTGIGGSVDCIKKTIIRITGGVVNALGTGAGAGIGAGKGNTDVAVVEIGPNATVIANGGNGYTDNNGNHFGAGAAIGAGGGMNNEAGATVTPVPNHVWDDGEITTQPTCTEAGVRTYTCVNCELTRTEEVPALGHDYGEWVADGEGHKTRTCSRCDASETVADEKYVAPVDPIPDVQPSESSDSSAAAYEALTVVGAPVYEQTVEDDRVVIAVPAQSASLRGSLGALKELKAQGAEILVFRTQLCESVVSIDALLARGSDETIFVLTHTESNATLTVAGQNADALLNH